MFGALKVQIQKAGLAMLTFNKIVGKNPFVKLASILLTVTAAVGTYIALNHDAEESQDDLNDTVGDGVKSYDKYEDKIQKVAKEQKALAKAQEKAAKAQKKLAKEHKKALDEILKLNETEVQQLLRKEKEKLKIIKDGLKNRSFSEIEAAKGRAAIAEFYGKKISAIEEEAGREAREEEAEKNRAIEDDRKRLLELFKEGKYKEGQINKASQSEMLDIVIATGSRTLDILATQNKKFFQLQKAVKIASAIQNTYEGATKAFAQGGMLGFITAALVIAAGMAQVSAIRGQTYPGRERGGPVGKGRAVIVGEAGEEIFVPQASGTIIPNDRMGSGAITLNFNISAIDTSDFDDLLMTRQDMIVGLINRSLRERGKRALTV